MKQHRLPAPGNLPGTRCPAVLPLCALLALALAGWGRADTTKTVLADSADAGAQKPALVDSIQGKNKDGIVGRLPDIVVSASLYEQSLDRLPRSAAVISRDDIDGAMRSNMIDMLAATPGFTQIWEYHSPLILRGMSSKQLIVMKNGNRRIGNFPGGYFGQDMNVYGAQRVEIIKGPGSVIYGSGAVAGIVNILSRPLFGVPQKHAGTLLGFGANNKELLVVPRVSLRRERFGVSLNGRFRTAGDIVYGGGEIGDNSDVTDGDVSLSAGGILADGHTLLFSADYHYGDWGKPRGFNGPTKAFTEVRNEENRAHSEISYEWNTGGVLEALSCNGYVDWGTRDYYKYKHSLITDARTALELVHYEDIYGGGRLFARLSPVDAAKITAGIDGYAFTLDNPADIIDYFNNTEGRVEGYSGAGQQSVGAFVNSEWAIGHMLDVTAGLRGDYARVLEGATGGADGRREERTAISGNIGAVFSPRENTHLSLNLGRAFRMPTAEELFVEVISCKGLKVGNPDLLPEYSNNLDIGIRGNAMERKLKYDLAMFYNKVFDFITDTVIVEESVSPQGDTTTQGVFTTKNSDARLMGGELSMSYRFENVLRRRNTLDVGVGAAYVYGVDLSLAVDAPLFGMPPPRAMFDLSYNGVLGKNDVFGYLLKVQCECAAAQDRIPEVAEGGDKGPWGYEHAEPYAVLNATLGANLRRPTPDMKLRVHVKNILDTEYYPGGSYVPAMGRNIKVTLHVGV
jgi:outer membrane receptor protein involved in Fe transport